MACCPVLEARAQVQPDNSHDRPTMSAGSHSQHSWKFVTHCIVAAFGTYFCMYAFRKPFAVGMYQGYELWGIDYKIVLVISQVLGYTLSKFTGIKIIAEMAPQRRISAILLCVVWLRSR